MEVSRRRTCNNSNLLRLKIRPCNIGPFLSVYLDISHVPYVTRHYIAGLHLGLNDAISCDETFILIHNDSMFNYFDS